MIRANLMEEKVGHFPIKLSNPHKTVHSNEPRLESPRGSLATKLNGIIAKKPVKSLSFSNFTKEIPVRLPIPNGIANKSPGKSLAPINNQLKDEIPASKNPSKSVSIFNMEESKVVETPVKAPANKRPGKSLSFSEEAEIIESPKRPSKSLAFSDMIESAAMDKPKIEIIAPKKSCKRLSWFDMEESKVEIPATKNSNDGLNLSILVESQNSGEGLSLSNILSKMEESKVESPISTEAAGESSNSLGLSVRRKAGRPPGAKNKGLSFSNTKKRRVRGPAMSNEEKPPNINLLTMQEPKVESPAATLELNGIATPKNKEPIAEPSPKPKTSRTRNKTQKHTQLAQLRGKTTGNDSCDVTESKPGRRRKANHF